MLLIVINRSSNDFFQHGILGFRKQQYFCHNFRSATIVNASSTTPSMSFVPVSFITCTIIRAFTFATTLHNVLMYMTMSATTSIDARYGRRCNSSKINEVCSSEFHHLYLFVCLFRLICLDWFVSFAFWFCESRAIALKNRYHDSSIGYHWTGSHGVLTSDVNVT